MLNLNLRGPLGREVKDIQKSNLFDANWYMERQGLTGDTLDAIRHYVQRGAAEGLDPHPIFDTAWYLTQGQRAASSALTPLGDFLVRSRATAVSPHPLFDCEWYLRTNPDRADKDSIPYRDYVRFGAAAGLEGHWAFQGQVYLAENDDLAARGINPLTDYLGGGERAGRKANPFFDADWYWEAYRDLVPPNRSALAHFISTGARAGLRPARDIDLDAYRREHPDCADALAAYRRLITVGADSFSRARSPKPRQDPGPEHSEVPVALEANGPIDMQEGYRLDGFPTAMSARPGPTDLDIPTASSVRLVSLDVWDTLIRRDCHPDEIKLQSARFLWLTAHDIILPAYRNLSSLYSARLSAEVTSAPNKEFEYRFKDAIASWLNTVLERGASVALRARLYAELLKHENVSERRATHADQSMKTWLKNNTLPTVFCSDFYLDRGSISDILSASGFTGPSGHGYVSSDFFENKRSGALFKRILREHDLQPSEMLHIGDNHFADHEIPKRLGIPSFLYVHKEYERRKEWYKTALSAFLNNDYSTHSVRIGQLVEAKARSHLGPTAAQALRVAGIRLSPLFFGFILRVMESAKRHGIETIYFFTREGAFFKEIYDRLCEANPFNCQYPQSQLLAVSRRATFAASSNPEDPKDWMRLWRQYSSQSLQGFCESLNIPSALYLDVAARHGIDSRAAMERPWDNPTFQAMLEDIKFKRAIIDACASQRSALLGYLESTGFDTRPGRSNMIVDIGWRGTIQDNISRVSECHIHGQYLGLFGFLNPQELNASKSGWVFDDNIGSHRGALEDVAPLEMICNSPGGSVIGYGTDAGGNWAPRKSLFEAEEQSINGASLAVQAGVLDAVPDLADYVRLHGLTSDALKPLSAMILDALIHRPPDVVANAFVALTHNETFGTGETDEIGRFSMDSQRMRALSGAELHAAATDLICKVRWPSGFVRSDLWSDGLSRLDPVQKLALPPRLLPGRSPAVIGARGSKIGVFTPPPIAGSGGHRTIYNVVRRLESLGFEPHIFLEGDGEGVGVVEGYLQGARAFIHRRWETGIGLDVAMATIAHSANFVATLPGALKRGYLVQDFEAAFNPLSDAFVLGENSYTYDLQHITVGNWLTHVIRNQYNGSAISAGLGIDTNIYKPLNDVEKESAICFLYQPDKPRRTPTLGIEALRIMKAARPDLKIYLYGSDMKIDLDFKYENFGLVHNLTSLNDLYNRCKIGLCISMSNPSRIPYEMMAAGCVPIDLYRYNNLFDHTGDAAILTYQSPQSIAAAALHLLDKESDLARRRAAGVARSRSRTLDWENDVIGNAICELAEGRSLPLDSVEITYLGPPVISQGELARPEVAAFCDWQTTLASTRRSVRWDSTVSGQPTESAR